MKRKGNLFPKIIETNNIKRAILSASSGKRDRKNVKKVYNNIDFYTLVVQNMLKNNKYFPSKYRETKIVDKNKRKERMIYITKFFPDQIVHKALIQQVEPLLARGMYELSCASVKSRGVHYASSYIKKILIRDKKNTKYCLKLDIKNFYPSINKELLKKKLMRLIKDREVINLLNLIIDNFETGIPIGNCTSQWFANYYLQDLDHYIKEQLKIPYYIRYMDDMLLFHRNKKELHKCRKLIEVYLHKESLNIKENWQLFKTDSRPIDFIGYRFYRGHTTLRRSNFLRIKRRIKRIYKKKKISYTDAKAFISYNGWIKHCDSNKFNEKYIKPYIKMKKCKGVIKRYEAKKLQRCKTK